MTNIKPLKSKQKYPEMLRARVTEECLAWFRKEAKNRDVNVSVFIRWIPNIIKSLEATLDEKDNIIRNMQKRIFELEKKITEMEEWACQ